MNRNLKLGLVLLFALGFLVRLYRFDGPVADWHSFRQSDTNAVSVIFARNGIDLLHPRYFDISNVQSGKDNPHGYRMVEFPIYNAVQAGLYSLFNFLTLEEWGRLISIGMTLVGALSIYLLVKKYNSENAGFYAAAFYLILPFSIFYGRSILPDPSMTASILAGTYFFDQWISKKNFKFSILNFKFFLAVLFTALAFLLKPYALFFTLPMVYLAFERFGMGIFKQWKLYLFAIISLIPLIFWRKWIGNFPEGIPVSDWLFNGNGIRFRPAFFKWIGYERVTKLILGYLGIIFAAAGVYSLKSNKSVGFFLSFILSAVLYVSVIATGNIQHDYYQIAIIPAVSIISGLGLAYLLERFKKNIFIRSQIFVLLAFAFFLSWNQVKDYFNINDRGMVAAAEFADEILPTDARVIAPYDGSTTFLNIIKRQGWPVFQEPIEKLIKRGAEYLVIANPTPSDFSGFGKMYKPVATSATYLILKLQ